MSRHAVKCTRGLSVTANDLEQLYRVPPPSPPPMLVGTGWRGHPDMACFVSRCSMDCGAAMCCSAAGGEYL